MISKIKALFKENKQILTNFMHLIFVQGVSFLLPLLLYGYLIRVVGLETFGLFALSQSILTYLFVITDYGFSLSATKYIATHKSNPIEISHIVVTVYLIKAGLILITFLFYVAMIFSIEKLYAHSFFFLTAYLIVLGKSFFPIWFFQGIEKMGFISSLSVIGRILIFLATIYFIHSPSTFMYLNLIYGIGEMLIGLISILVLGYIFHIRFRFPPFNIIKEQLVEGWFIFISNFSINIYVNSNVPILAIFATDYIVGVFGAVEKIIVALKQISNVLMQAIYPRACRLAEENQHQLQVFMRNIFAFLLVGYTIVGFFLIFGADLLIWLYKGENNPDMVITTKILSFVPLIVALNMPAYQIMVINGLHKSYVSILFSGAVLNIVLAFLFSYLYEHIGIAITMIVVEIFITLGLHILLVTKHKKYSIFAIKTI